MSAYARGEAMALVRTLRVRRRANVDVSNKNKYETNVVALTYKMHIDPPFDVVLGMYDIVIEDYPLRGSTMPLLRGAKSERGE